MTRTGDRRAARREARKRRAELRLFDAAWTYGAAFDTRDAPVLRQPGDSELAEVPSEEALADLVAAALHFAMVVPRPRRRRQRRRRTMVASR